MSKHKILGIVSSIVAVLRCHYCIKTLSFLRICVLENLLGFHSLMGLPADLARLECIPKES